MKRRTVIIALAATIAFLAETVSTEKDYYAVLGVPKTAAENVIKRAYRKLSLKYHPDKVQGDKQVAEKKFMEIATAYEVLSDSKKRKVLLAILHSIACWSFLAVCVGTKQQI